MPTLRFPYTVTSKMMQFPTKYYYNNVWGFRYWCYGLVASAPVFWWIQTKARSEGNWKNYQAYREKEARAHAEHH